MANEQGFSWEDVTTPDDLNRLDKDGLIAFLKNHPDRKVKSALWNAWHAANISRDRVVDLSGADLQFANLSNVSLHRVNLAGAALGEADLSGADLLEANLAGASLWQTRLRNVSLSEVTDGGLRGVRLYRANFRGILSLRYDQFIGEDGRSTIWGEAEGRFYEAKDVYKTLKGTFESAGDYEGANWAYVREQVMEKLMYARAMPRWCKPFLKLIYPRWRDKLMGKQEDEAQGSLEYPILNWLRMEFSDKIAHYGTSLLLPFAWMFVVLIVFAAIYWLGGMVTYIDLHTGTLTPSTRNVWHNLIFSATSMFTIEMAALQPATPFVGMLETVQAFFGFGLTGLIGFVLGNKLRYS
ncbi:MAG: pentapeptide repeat-containing protein [Anaerolineae bacterium]|nr:pentapeptide repeat-containing protein [Anaerolineae bacterium]